MYQEIVKGLIYLILEGLSIQIPQFTSFFVDFNGDNAIIQSVIYRDI